jgi:hypothetical protein
VTKHARVSSNNLSVFVYLGPLSYQMSMLLSSASNAFIELVDIHTGRLHQLSELAVMERSVRAGDQTHQREFL